MSEQPTPSAGPAPTTAPQKRGLNTWLAAQPAPASASGPVLLDLDLLDSNPEQPRKEFDESELAELAASIKLQGLIQAITVTKADAGRFFIVAGERRTIAYRRLRDAAVEPAERARWAKIPAIDRGPTTSGELAELALIENLQRANLRPVETAEAIARLRDEKKLSAPQLAERLSLDLTRTKRLLSLAAAPPALRQAMNRGLMVELPETGEEKPRREHRQLEFNHALHVLRAHGHLVKTKPKKALDLTRALIERVLAEGWTVKRLTEYVDNLIAGRPTTPAPTPEAAATDVDGEATAPTQAGPPVFQDDGSKLVIHRPRIANASPDARGRLRHVLTELLESLA